MNEWPTEELWILARLNRTAHDVNLALDKYRFDDAANLIYQFFWGEFCDWYLEFAKMRLNFEDASKLEDSEGALSTLLHVFEASLRMLSPFMPFITEEIWHALYEGNPPTKSIALTQFPTFEKYEAGVQITFDSSEIAMQTLQHAITGIRSRRKDLKIEERATVKVKLAGTLATPMILRKHTQIIEKLARVRELEIVSFAARNSGGQYESLQWQSAGPVDLYVENERKIDAAAEREKMDKEIARQEKIIANSDRQLNNPGFTAKAPAHIVEGLKKQRDEAQQLLDKLRRDLDSLPPE
jgi:valyl-tRNA synthetase